MNEPLEIRIGDRTHGATLSECLEWAEEVRLKNEYITQLEAEIAAWEAKAALFVDQGEELQKLQSERDALVRYIKIDLCKPIVSYPEHIKEIVKAYGEIPEATRKEIEDE